MAFDKLDGVSNEAAALARRKGHVAEVRLKALLHRVGWDSALQPGSGASGTRSGTTHRQGDLWASCGEAKLRIEVKHYEHEPRTLQALRGGADVLAYFCSSSSRMAVFIDENLFRDLLAWSAASLRTQMFEPGRPRLINLDRVRRASRGAHPVDAEIARARLENVIAAADDSRLVQIERLVRCM